jgi:hypothetical protein
LIELKKCAEQTLSDERKRFVKAQASWARFLIPHTSSALDAKMSVKPTITHRVITETTIPSMGGE